MPTPGDTPSDDTLAALRRQRRQQGGAVTRAQALAAGFSPARIATLVRRGTWVDAQRGVYLEGAALAAADVWAEQALLVAARALAMRGRHAASRRTASLVLGLPLLGTVPVPPELVRARLGRGDSSSSSSIKVAALPAQDLTRWRDVESTAPARLVCDLARTHGQVEALMVVDAALRAGLSRADLTQTAARCAGWTGGGAIAEVLARAEARTDSPLESLTRWVLHRLGLPAPMSQVDVLHEGAFLGRADFAWPELGVVLEADGMGKYGDGALVAEKRRELQFRRAGLEVVRTIWDDAWSHPERIRAQWRAHVALATARVDQRRGTRFQPALLEPTGARGIPFPSKAARPLPRT